MDKGRRTKRQKRRGEPAERESTPEQESDRKVTFRTPWEVEKETDFPKGTPLVN